MCRRAEFSAQTKRDAYERSGGICECHRIPWLKRPQGCGSRLGPGNTFYEHINPDGIRPDASLENCAVLSKTCWREKTDRYDKPVIAKSNRARDRNRGIRPDIYRPLAGTVASGWKHKMIGGWERR